MSGAPILPPLPSTTTPGNEEEKQVTLVRAHEDAAAPAAGRPAAGMGDNLLTAGQRDILRTGILRVRHLQREIDRLNREKSATYDAMRREGVDPALARKVVYRLSLSAADLEAIAERDAKLATYWSAVEDMRPDEDEDAAPDAAPNTAP